MTTAQIELQNKLYCSASSTLVAWLVSKESPVSQASSLVILKSATVSHPTLLSSSPYNPTHKKTQGLQNPSVSHITRRLNICAGMSAYMSASKVVWGKQLVVSEPPRAPGCYST